MDLFTTGVLVRVVAALPRPVAWLLDHFFPFEQTETSEEIHFDLEHGRRRLAPFVSPLVEGKVVAGKGYTTDTFKPAYIKDKRVFDPNKPIKRVIGEKIGGALNPADRLRLLVASELADQLDGLTRRLEVMAAEALLSGRVTVSGDLYPTTVVNFGRDAGLGVAVDNAAQWGDTGVSPLDNLMEWALLVMQKSGVFPSEVVMTPDVWKVFRANPEVLERLDTRRVEAATMRLEAVASEGGTYMGTIDKFNIYVYAGWYENDSGDLTPYLPDGTVIMSGSGLEGARAFGAIRDEKAGYQAMPYFPKSWVQEDPAVRFLMMQSAPLVVPYRVNASLSASNVVAGD